MVIIDYAVRQAIIALITGTAHPLDGATLTVGLYHTPLSPTTRPVRADVLAAAATFTGSTPVTPITWGTQYRDGNDVVYRDGGLLEWVCSASPVTPETLYGVYWDDGVNVHLDPFPTPQVIAAAGDIVRYLMSFAYAG